MHQNGASLDKTLLGLGARFDGLTYEKVSPGVERIQRALTPRQCWLLSTLKRHFEPLEAALLAIAFSIPHPARKPLHSNGNGCAGLARALARLPSADRFMLRLRFEQHLTLDQVARLSGLPRCADGRPPNPEDPRSSIRPLKRTFHLLIGPDTS